MNVLKRTALAVFALAVGVLTMPIWPIIFAAMVWNDSVDEDDDCVSRREELGLEDGQ